MTGHHAVMAALREHGYRLTPQREMVLGVLHEAEGHLSAEEIHARVQQQNPCVDRSTVYRTLDLLRSVGLVSQVPISAEADLYELTFDAPHHHLACRRCKRVIDIPPDVVDELARRLRASHGFAADLDHLVIPGLCVSCAADASESEATRRR